ncbi:hypothetical protein BC829DRAFT_410992 [Chytridium lagenaria]|nr:hypothetical protein BC829DRAFT_410992 [Chytridium lagenaria]
MPRPESPIALVIKLEVDLRAMHIKGWSNWNRGRLRSSTVRSRNRLGCLLEKRRMEVWVDGGTDEWLDGMYVWMDGAKDGWRWCDGVLTRGGTCAQLYLCKAIVKSA